MKILITGDLVVNKPYDTAQINKKIVDLFESSDLNIVNLEAPVTEGTSKIIKTGPHIKSHRESTLEVLKKLEIDIVTLANNHVLDYNEQGLADTLAFCNENKFKTVGAGMNLQLASETLFIDNKEGKVAILNFAENEWSSADEANAGANPMDIIDNTNQIKKAKKKADYVFVIIHGGNEHYPLPSPRVQKQYRFYAEQGADLIIAHHTHCISGHEEHQGVPIYYSLGNFLFTLSRSLEHWYTGLVLEIQILNGKISTQIHPVKQEKHDFELELLAGEDKIKILNRVSALKTIIEDPLKLKKEWYSFIEFKEITYLNHLSPQSFIRNRYIRGLLNKLPIKMLNKKGMALSLNLMRCESHSDLSKAIIEKYLKEN